MLEELIAAPLKALVDAQRESADATRTFLLSLMKEKDGKNIPDMLNIVYEQTLQNPETGELEPQEQSLSIPILSLIPIPYISIDESEIEFDAKIITSKKDKFERTTLYAAYASKGRSSIDITSEMHVKIKAKRSEIPEGLAKILTILSNPSVKEE
ncbi:MAG: alpha-amylase [Candidatus Nitrosocaldaceae archaeon]|nr:MAG: alpha-amylase [Candidatus Nitrosocaldaceae archaeon]